MTKCACDNFAPNGPAIKADAHQCKNCLGYKSGLEIKRDEIEKGHIEGLLKMGWKLSHQPYLDDVSKGLEGRVKLAICKDDQWYNNRTV